MALHSEKNYCDYNITKSNLIKIVLKFLLELIHDSNSKSCRVETRTFLRGIDVNWLPSTVDVEDKAGVSSPNSTISSVSSKRREREAINGLGGTNVTFLFN
ncbi:hypothetical protein G4B88_022264 [Cannabis sativa]|uniref:HD-ZIP protein N-terminal domain-containing protein n=1 Tax=Cannabis sativa TaxID=3483 RepID=A0A7J6EEE0_CANSA|nr:hypothetical protein G4B88_022264 [Cannabis sativa]